MRHIEVMNGWVDVKSIAVLPEGKKEDDDEFDDADAAMDTAEFTTMNTSSASKEVSPNKVKASQMHASKTKLIDDTGQAGEGFSEFEDSHVPAHSSLQFHGRCGFVVRLRPDAPSGPWMCHHFTLDGTHCVSYGLGKQHANRCAGVLHPINAEAHNLDDPRPSRRCMGLRKPGDGNGYPLLVRCGKAATAPACRPDSCPYIAQNLLCPYAARAAEVASLAATRAAAVTSTDALSCTTAATAPTSDIANAQPEPDSDFSPMHTPGRDFDGNEPTHGPIPSPFEDIAFRAWGAGLGVLSPGYSSISPQSGVWSVPSPGSAARA